MVILFQPLRKYLHLCLLRLAEIVDFVCRKFGARHAYIIAESIAREKFAQALTSFPILGATSIVFQVPLWKLIDRR